MEEATGAQQGYKSRFYAVAVTGGMEEKVAVLLAERAKNAGYDVRSVLVSPSVKGYVILEIGDPDDLYHVIRGVRHVKRRRPVLMKEEEVVKLAKPLVEVAKLERGQIVEVIYGPFKGMKGRVVEIYEGRGEVDLALLESELRMVITLPLDQVKPIEEEQG
ncbi:MAG: transcription elongation factor Spt5 [Desulfurococcales archaeon]|nr:transcription elongation factor Spt5 [Desulfurococcales archaeon]